MAAMRPVLMPGSKIEQTMSQTRERLDEGGGKFLVNSFKSEFDSFNISPFIVVAVLRFLIGDVICWSDRYYPGSIMKKAIDVNDLEAQFLGNNRKKPAFVIGDYEEDIEDVVQLNDEVEFEGEAVIIPLKNNNTFSYAAATGKNNANSNNSALTVEELEAQLLAGMVVGPKSPVSQLVVAGPPPGMSSGNPVVMPVTGISNSSSAIASFTTTNISSSNSSNVMSSTAPLLKNDPNREFMNRFERNLIMKIHTTQLTTETPLMDDFYYQALTKKKAMMAEGTGPLLYFPLPSAAERQKELQRRELRKKQREKEREKERGKEENNSSANVTVEISAELVLGKVSHSTSRKPRQQLQIPAMTISTTTTSGNPMSLNEKVLKGIEAIYADILAVEDFYLLQEEFENRGDNSSAPELPDLKELTRTANETIYRELNFRNEAEVNHEFIHFLTIPKGKSIVSRLLKLLDEEGKEKFLSIMIEHFDFLEIVRPETGLNVIDAFIAQVLSPLVGFVGEAEWPCVLEGLKGLFGKRSFVWIALTKAGMVLLCILLSRLEILKASAEEVHVDTSALLTEKMFDALEGHLLEFFSSTDPSRDFYAWQFLALLAMNVESDRKRSMILELRDKILVVVETGDERQVKNLNVFLNALGLDASQLK